MGADDYVSKPIDKTELVSRVLNRLQLAQMRHRQANFPAKVSSDF